MDENVRESLRAFAGRIAHDFNNLLTPLLAYPELIRSELEEGSPGHELMNVIVDTADTMAEISTRLAEFALRQRDARHPLDISETVREVLVDVEESSLAAGVTVVSDLEPGVLSLIPHDALRMAATALCRNSVEAMCGRGRLTVSTGVVSFDEDHETSTGMAPPGEYALVMVRDTGPGMSEETRARAFEPFFTTHKNAKARGSGMGLTIALSMVRDCGGFITLGEAGEEPFSVSILYPLLTDEQLVVDAPDVVADVTPETSILADRVLVVDDEEPIVDLFKLMLETAIPGLHVDIARNGQEALDAFRQHRHKVIVMDLHMPVMDGQSAFRALIEMCTAEDFAMPGVVFCTGYAPPDGVSEAIAGKSHHDLLHKPVTSEGLVSAVRARLESQAQ